MTEKEIIRTLDKMICDREELLRHGENSALREEIYALGEVRAGYFSVLDLETEYKLLQKEHQHVTDEVKSREDEVNKLRYELGKLHAELEKAKKPKRYIEVLLTDGLPAVRIENGAYFRWTEEQLVIYNKSDKITAVFNDVSVGGVIKQGKWENDED